MLPNIYKIQDNFMYIDDTDALELTKGDIYEPQELQLIKSLVKSNDLVLDIGAHIGYYTLILSKLAKYIWAFEPQIDNYDILNKNLRLNKVENVETRNCAVSDEDGNIDLYTCNFNSGMNRIYKNQYCDEYTKVECVRIDTLISNGIISDNIGFIKMDIEGSEFGALKGMYKLLRDSHPIVLMEFHPPGIEEYGANAKSQYDYMKALDYKITLVGMKNYEEFPMITYDELDYNTRHSVARNIICTPK